MDPAELWTYVNRRTIRGGLHCSKIIIKLVKVILVVVSQQIRRLTSQKVSLMGLAEVHLVSPWQTGRVREESKLKLPP